MMSPSDALRGKVAELMPRAKADLSELVAFRSVADSRQQPPDGARGRLALLDLAPRVPIRTRVTEYPLERAAGALDDLRSG